MRGDGNRNRDSLDSVVRNDFTGSANGPVVQTGSIYGGVHLHSPRHRYDLRPYTIPARPDPAELRRQPSQLLLASNRVVPFTGRENERARLRQWLDNPDRMSAKLVHAPGGHGKTRLAAEFAAESIRAGWDVLVAHHAGLSESPEHELISPTPGRGVLVIVDYAERWPRTDLLALFEDGRIRHTGPTRVLLLARSGSRWWDLLRYPLHKLRVHTETERLTELAADVPTRRAVFESARNAFAHVLNADASHAGPAGSLTDNAYRSVLTILMAALAAVDACDRDRMPPAHPGALASYLLDREADHWAGMRSGGAIELATNVLARVVFLATLSGPMSYPEGCDALQVAGLARTEEEASRLLDDHQACYPPMDDGVVLTPLSPDRMGEDLVARYLPGGEEPGDPRAPELIRMVLTLSALRRAQVITVLAEASRRWPHVARHLAALVREDPDRVITAGGGALMAVVDTADPDLLAAIEPRLPAHRHVDLDFPAARLTQRLTELRLAHTRHPAEQANLHLVLGRRLANAGAFDEALKSSERAVRIYEGLVAKQPGRYETVLAEALHHLGTHLSGAGFAVRALNATGKAVAIRQRLAKAHPAVHEPDLASSLNNQALDLSGVGLRDAALRAAQEAVAILHRLAATHPALHEPGLATALNTLGMHLAEVGRHREACTAARQAVRLHHRLAATNPKMFEPDLAASLHNLGHHSSQLGWWADALEAAEQAVAIRRRLAITNPAMFEPDLALSLRELAAIYLELDRVAEALIQIGLAVDLHRNLALVNPAVHQAELATSLHNQGVYLARAGAHVQAVTCARQAVTIRAAVFEANLHAFELKLNDVLAQLGVALPGSPRTLPPPADARVLQHEVNAIFRESSHSTAQSTDNLGARSTTAHRLTAAIAATHPRWADHLRPAAARLITLEAQLARTFSNLSSRHIALGRLTEALIAAERSAATYQRIAEIDHAHRADSASSLANLGARLVEYGRRDQALTATRLAVERIGVTGRDRQVADCLQTFAWVRMISKLELDDAMRAAEMSVRIYRQLGPVYAHGLRTALKTCAELLHEVGRVEEAIAIKRELRAPTKELFLRTPQLTSLTKRPALVAGTAQGQNHA